VEDVSVALARRCGAVAAVLLLAALPASAEKKVAAWFGGKDGAPYGGVQPAIEKAAGEAVAARVPEELLVERLAEGAAKGVAPQVMQRAMEEGAASLAALAAILDDRMPRLESGLRTDALRLGAIAVRGGIDIAIVDAAVAWTIEGGGDLGRTMSALVAVASLDRGLDLDGDRALALAKAFSLSREKTSRFGAFVSLLSGARARGLAADTVIDAALSALAEGRTFLALQRELDRRSKP
jgi:hypothetical protein